jgi:hypothetical protein
VARGPHVCESSKLSRPFVEVALGVRMSLRSSAVAGLGYDEPDLTVGGGLLPGCVSLTEVLDRRSVALVESSYSDVFRGHRLNVAATSGCCTRLWV